MNEEHKTVSCDDIYLNRLSFRSNKIVYLLTIILATTILFIFFFLDTYSTDSSYRSAGYAKAHFLMSFFFLQNEIHSK